MLTESLIVSVAISENADFVDFTTIPIFFMPIWPLASRVNFFITQNKKFEEITSIIIHLHLFLRAVASENEVNKSKMM